MFFSQKEAWDAADPRRGPPPAANLTTGRNHEYLNSSSRHARRNGRARHRLRCVRLRRGSRRARAGAATCRSWTRASWKAPAASAAGMTTIWRSWMRKASRTTPRRTSIKFYAKPLDGWTPSHAAQRLVRPHEAHALDKLEAGGRANSAGRPDGRYLRTAGLRAAGDAGGCHIANGMTIKRVMARLVRESGVDVLDRVMAVKILTDGGKACGALGWNVTHRRIRAWSVRRRLCRRRAARPRAAPTTPRTILTTCGCIPTTPARAWCSATTPGAAVTELDTYQRATMLPKGYGCPGMNGINSSGAHEINALGERFMGKYDPMWENGVRNNQIQGTFQEQLEGFRPAFLHGYAACGRSRGARAAGHPDARRQGHVRRLGGMHRYRLPAQAPRSGNRRTDLRRDHRRERPASRRPCPACSVAASSSTVPARCAAGSRRAGRLH